MHRHWQIFFTWLYCHVLSSPQLELLHWCQLFAHHAGGIRPLFQPVYCSYSGRLFPTKLIFQNVIYFFPTTKYFYCPASFLLSINPIYTNTKTIATIQYASTKAFALYHKLPLSTFLGIEPLTLVLPGHNFSPIPFCSSIAIALVGTQHKH